MANTFSHVPEGAQERSSASLEVDDPQGVLERIMEEANLHRGSLREQDGYTIPFREGGSVRIRVVPEGDQDGGAGLRFVVSAPTAERRDYIQGKVSELATGELGADEGALAWRSED